MSPVLLLTGVLIAGDMRAPLLAGCARAGEHTIFYVFVVLFLLLLLLLLLYLPSFLLFVLLFAWCSISCTRRSVYSRVR